ncbi:MAG: UbiA family prenyltransferase [candidate division Zixibacteria bacterium]|nr:UbiA family prenyltransferase [candidate division Zixibacteria bacterium]
MTFFDRIVVYGRMIKFSHSVFALPFAFSGAALAADEHGITPAQVGWILAAMVGARSAAMGFNRLVDRHIDALNPRTANRELPRGVIAPGTVAGFVAIASALFVFAAYNLNPLCFALSPVALGVVFSYSYLKRFTWTSHFMLGLSLGIAPIGAWIAITGAFAFEPILLTLAVLTWVAGFDIIYACQDYEFDTRHGLFSIPQRLGIGRALMTARILHVGTVAALISVGGVFSLHSLYLVGVAIVSLMLVYEHALVRANDLSRVNVAFFTVNGIIGVVYFFFTVGAVWTDV